MRFLPKVLIALSICVSAFVSMAQASVFPTPKQMHLPEDTVRYSTAKNATVIAILNNSDQISLMNYLTGEELSRFQVQKNDLSHPEYLEVSPDGQLVAIVNFWGPHVVVYDAKSGSRLYQFSYWGISDTPLIRFSNDGAFAAIADPWIANGAFFNVVEARTGKVLQKLGYKEGEEGFKDLQFTTRDNKPSLISLSDRACQLSIWDLTTGEEKKLAQTCVKNIRLVDDKGLYAEGDFNVVTFYNMLTAQKVSRITNTYQPPQSKLPTWASIQSYDLNDGAIFYLGAGPDLQGTYLRSFEIATAALRFEYDVTSLGARSIKIVKADGHSYLVMSNPKALYFVDLSTL
jgi:hypothetical protein